MLDPRVDLAFKKIFGNPNNKHLLISLINAIVCEQDQVSDVTILNPYNDPEHVNDKLSILDIKACDVNGKYYLIEMQMTDEDDYDKRALYYWAKTYSKQLKKGQDYGELRKVVGIHILNFLSVTANQKYHNSFKLQTDTSELFCNDIELHTIELEKFSRNAGPELKDIVQTVRTSLDRWATFLTKAKELASDPLPSSLDTPELNEAIDALKQLELTQAEEEVYESHEKYLWAVENALKKAKRKGHVEGHAEGRAEGIDEGIQRERSRLAELLKANGIPVEDIKELHMN